MQIKQQPLDPVTNCLQESWASTLYLEDPRDARRGPWNDFQENLTKILTI